MYYEVAYGHVSRYSKADSASEAAKDAFGVSSCTVAVLPKSPKYMSYKLKRELQQKLALRHFKRTGSILSGWENEPGIKNVHWTQCPKCKKSILTEPASAGVDGQLCTICDPQWGPKDL